ncbi:HD domain-containing protein [Roseiconus nitratireducens]|uniref:HD domain-containing protein n=1 Tax=Roseiconus nitratireducens TaxID=2605748 RepID=A0A5M6CXU1_9BACT|nr:HD domain-containing protein [Roseiconus nitratireducens]KAA5540034.1 HD domain-containing protein [Roseiconus nitratireducens]
MLPVLDIPEIDLLHRAGSVSGSLVRIPPADSVPLSQRVRRVLDTAPLRRLAGLSQLGMVSLVYPGAMHTRLEHTLGVYRNALQFLARFKDDPVTSKWLDNTSCDAFVLAALLHDVGHWPFCHPIEDMQLEDLPRHESRVADLLHSGELADCIREDWRCTSDDIQCLLDPDAADKLPDQSDAAGEPNAATRFLRSCLSGPIDIDKLDYLQRDSLHCGVPYGRNFDAERLVSSLVADPESNRLAIGEKGRTAGEMMVFARYVMFSEVYWHHAVRAATAMLQRSVFLLRHRIDLNAALKLADAEWIALIRRTAEGSLAEPLVEGLFGPRRQLFKRVAEFSVLNGPAIHSRLARRPYWWLVALCETLATRISRQTGIAVAPADLLIDAPPVKLEVDINTAVRFADGRSVTLGDVSPVAAVLAQQQFDNHVKRVRVFVRPDLRACLRKEFPAACDWSALLVDAIEAADEEVA